MGVKICGLSTEESIEIATVAGAAYIGFMFFEKSPRHLAISQAKDLALSVQAGVCKVAVTVNATDAELTAILDSVPIDMLQLHGSETPERVTEIKALFGLPVMKVVGIADVSDLPAINVYSKVADQLLIETKPAKDAVLPGGNGLPFDWRLIAGRKWAVPWMLAGGLGPDNVAQAMLLSGAQQVDVSSGVESAPGIKDNGKIAEFIRAAKG